ncbi:MAG: ATP-binding cassette domain-containing protein [Clostridia bacterium]|nr:ATP-binding cassette domain-containing protein [Clostridia bacterium]MBR2288089.1 ATP-binding cassette domain-containing protein [Clostridia bacterium]
MITIDHVSKTFKSKERQVDALRDVSIHVEAGDIYGIIGFSGAGKSTLIRLVNRLETPDTGSILVDGSDLSALSKKELRTLRRRIGMVFQQFNLLSGKTVYHNVALPLILAGHPKEEIKKKVDDALKFVELEDKREAYVSELSGGQKQRVGIARALVTDPKILLCDEATSALDPQTTASILQLLKRVNREMGVTILLITHQMSVIQMICNRVAVMEEGRLVEEGPVLEVFGRPREKITQRFVRTVISDQIPENFQRVLRKDNRHFRVELLKFIGDAVEKPVIASLCQTPGLEVNILGATMQEVQESTLSLFIVQLVGEDTVIEAAEKFIDESGALRERVQPAEYGA